MHCLSVDREGSLVGSFRGRSSCAAPAGPLARCCARTRPATRASPTSSLDRRSERHGRAAGRRRGQGGIAVERGSREHLSGWHAPARSPRVSHGVQLSRVAQEGERGGRRAAPGEQRAQLALRDGRLAAAQPVHPLARARNANSDCARPAFRRVEASSRSRRARTARSSSFGLSGRAVARVRGRPQQSLSCAQRKHPPRPCAEL